MFPKIFFLEVVKSQDSVVKANDIILKLKQIETMCRQNIKSAYCSIMMCVVNWVEDIVGKGENDVTQFYG